MIERRASPGITLVELVFALSLLGILIGIAYPQLRSGLDRLAVRGARDALHAGVARARAAAIARGGASLVVELEAGRYRVRDASGREIAPPVEFGPQYRVEVRTDGAAVDSVVLRFDGRGLGRLANRTFRLRRGRAEARLTLSNYGRPRRW